MRRHASELEALNVRVVIVTFEATPIAMAYMREADLSWPLLVDRERTVYHAYGMERGTWWNVLGPSSWWVYIKLIARGNSLRLPSDDTRQLGGDVLIDADGIVRLHHVGSTPADRPSVESLLQAVRRPGADRDAN